MTHSECRGLFVEALYGELDSSLQSEFEKHVGGCSECNIAFQDLQFTTSIMSRRVRPEPTRVDWTIFWNELSDRITHTARMPGKRVSPWERIVEFFRFRPAAGYLSAALTILVVGMMIGRFLFLGTPGLDTQRLSERLSEAERTILNERAQNYLQRSKVLLLGIVNGNGVTPSSYDISKQQEVSRMLVKEAGPLRSQLTEADQQQMKKLIGDLEVILLQLANLEKSKDMPGLEIVRDGVERNGLLLKINLEQMNIQEAHPAPVTKSGSKSSSI